MDQPADQFKELVTKTRAPRLRGRFWSKTIAFLTGHLVARYVCSLAPLTPLTRSAAFRFATLALLAHSVHGLAHSLVRWLKFMRMCSHCKRVSQEQTRFWRSLETRPNTVWFYSLLLPLSLSRGYICKYNARWR